jgi:hypothetical protein
MPRDFALGCVTPIYKAGDVSSAANYRPITLLNSDYKLLAKVLAVRFGTAMSPSTGSEQTAFLPGREIGEGIAATQLLAAELSAAGRPGAMLVLDIAKAYDTVGRGFLVRVMRAQGASEGMIRWVTLLLSDPRAVARVGGCVSRPAIWRAGVRQGCPLSPVLYLFVAQALACWLRELPEVGIVVGGHRVVSMHHADDTRVFLASLASSLVARLLAHLTQFASASGQRVHPAKSCAVPLGTLQPDAPDTTQAVPVRASTVSLGITVSGLAAAPVQLAQRDGLRIVVRPPPPPPPDPPLDAAWERRIRGTRARAGIVAGLHLSAMGRGMSVSSYAVSRALYHAEHEGLPRTATQALAAAMGRAVDRPRRVPGLRSALLGGSPSVGGFGLLPLQQHITSRSAKWAGVLLRHLAPPPRPPGPHPSPAAPAWLLLAEVVLRRVCPSLHPAQSLLLAAFSLPDHVCQGYLTGVSAQRLQLPVGPLRRMGMALQSLGVVHSHPRAERCPPCTVLEWLQRPALPQEEVGAVLQGLVWG